MQTPPAALSLIGKLDTGLAALIRRLLRGLMLAILWLFGLITLGCLKWVIFEYGEGLADLSLLEVGFMVLMALLLWRHVHYCRYRRLGIWAALARLLTAQGMGTALQLTVIGVVLLLAEAFGQTQSFLDFLWRDDPVTKCLTFAGCLLAVYLAAPSALPRQVAEPAPDLATAGEGRA